INDGLAFGDVADCGFPAVARSETTSLHNAAAWKAKEPGVHVSKKLDQIRPKSVGPVLPCIEREQGNHVEIDRALLVKEQIDLCVLLGSAGADHGFILLPGISETLQFSAPEFTPARIGDRGANRRWPRSSDKSREPIFRPAFNADAAESSVVHPVSRFVNGDPEVMGIGGTKGVVGHYPHLTFVAVIAARRHGQNLVPSHQWLVKFEGAVLDAFGIEAAIRAEIDVLKKNSEHLRRNHRAGMSDIHGDNGRALLTLADQTDRHDYEKENGERSFSHVGRRPF